MSSAPNLGFRGSANPFVQVLSVLVAGIALVAAFFLGAVLFAVILGLAVVGSVALVLRIWWLRRKLRRAGAAPGGSAAGAPQDGRLIDAEYTVLEQQELPADRAGRDSRDGARR